MVEGSISLHSVQTAGTETSTDNKTEDSVPRGGQNGGTSACIQCGRMRCLVMATLILVLAVVGYWSYTVHTAAHSPKVNPSPLGCGTRSLVGPPGRFRIVAGEEALEGAWPWQVYVGFVRIHLCGGVILNSTLVVTAAHCFDKYDKVKFLSVVAGTNMVREKQEGSAQFRAVQSLIRHSGYTNGKVRHDIALLVLESPLVFNDLVQPICIPRDVSHELKLNLKHCYVSGWGKNASDGVKTEKLMEIDVKLIYDRKCNSMPPHMGRITRYMICAAVDSSTKDACRGDSGGPLQCYSEDTNRFHLVGVVSFGRDCGVPNEAGVYTRTSMYIDWMQEMTKESGIFTVGQ